MLPLRTLRWLYQTSYHRCYSQMRLTNDKWNQWETRPLNIEPFETSVILFPGQGAQFVGMTKKIKNRKIVNDLFDKASSYLRTNLLKICTEGPSNKLMQTIHCQPAIFTTSLAAIMAFQEENPKLVENCVAIAGFSSGEIAALVFGGALTFEEGLYLTQVRAQAMQEASLREPGGMASVFINHNSQLSAAMAAAKAHCTAPRREAGPYTFKQSVTQEIRGFTNISPESDSSSGSVRDGSPGGFSEEDENTFTFENEGEINRESSPPVVCQVANYLFSDCKVIAGNIEAIDYVMNNAEQFQLGRVKRLPVSGAFHTSLMFSARKSLERAIEKLPTGSPKSPLLPIISNVDARPYTTPEDVRRKLCNQVTCAVKWEQTLHALYSRPPDIDFPKTIEVGPGRQLGSMLRAVNRKAFESYQAIPV